MFKNQDYLQVAIDNEIVFRSILQDLKDNRCDRPMGRLVPYDLDVDSCVEKIYEKYSAGDRLGKFTIAFFDIDGDEATLGFQDTAILSGGGASLKYSLGEGDSVEFMECDYFFK